MSCTRLLKKAFKFLLLSFLCICKGNGCVLLSNRIHFLVKQNVLDQAQFYDQLLSVIVDQGDPIVLALWEPVIDWWRAACTDPDTIGVSTIAVGDPMAAAAVENWKYKTLLALKQRGHGPHASKAQVMSKYISVMYLH